MASHSRWRATRLPKDARKTVAWCCARSIERAQRSVGRVTEALRPAVEQRPHGRQLLPVTAPLAHAAGVQPAAELRAAGRRDAARARGRGEIAQLGAPL